MQNPQHIVEEVCFHCGAPCEESEAVHREDKAFCCFGCEAVHSILVKADMNSYYSLEEFPGVKRTTHRKSFAFADNAELASKYILHQSGQSTTIQLRIPSIHCSSCVWLLENLGKLQKGIHQSRVNFDKQLATIQFDQHSISFRHVLELLDKIGYTPELLSNEQVNEQSGSSLLKKMALAGFVFGNIMLFSFPEYFGLVSTEDHHFGKVFSYINLVLAIPLLFYSGKDYLTTAWDSIKMKTLHIYVPVSIGILSLFFWSTYEVLSGSGAGYFDSLAGLIFFLLVGKWFQEFTNRKLVFDREYDAYFPLAAQVIKEGEELTVAIHDVKKGDRIRIRKGELIPADGYLFGGEGQLDYSFVTGESVPEFKTLGEMVYAGGRQLSEAIEVEVAQETKHSKLMQLWEDRERKESKANSLIAVTSKYFTISLLLVAGITFFYWLQFDLNKAVFSMVSVLIVACPCALALAYPFATGAAKRLLAKQQVYLRKASIIESIAGIKQLIFDKTGTLSRVLEYEPNYVGKTLSTEEVSIVKALVSCSDHPYSRSIAKTLPGIAGEVKNVNEVPGKGIEGWVNNRWVKIGSEQYIFEDAYCTDPHHQVYLSLDGEYCGAFDFKSNYFPFIQKLLKRLKRKGYKLHLCTGDADRDKAFLSDQFSFDNMVFRAEPMDKVRMVEKQNESSSTMYLGDGLNDAGALKSANVGVAVTKSLIHFTPASDVIIENTNLEQLPSIFKLSKKVMQVVKVGIAVSALYNVVGLWFAVQGLLSPVVAAILMPISSITTVILMTGLTHLHAKRIFKT